MKRDRFVAREAGADEGTLRTVPLVVGADNVSINASVKGDLRVAVLDETGSGIDGFGAEDCGRMQGDSLTHTPRWQHPLTRLRGKTIQLLFSFRQSQLYAFEWA